MTSPQIEYIFSIQTQDVPGMLVRITQVFSRRGCNIASLVVQDHHSFGEARRVIDVAAYGVDRPDQIEKQLSKLIDVYEVTTKKLIDLR